MVPTHFCVLITRRSPVPLNARRDSVRGGSTEKLLPMIWGMRRAFPLVNMYVTLDVSLYADIDRIAGEYVIHVTGGTLRRL